MQQELQDFPARVSLRKKSAGRIVFDFSIVRQVNLRQVSQKVPENVVALVSVEDESEFPAQKPLSRCFRRKEPPSFLMKRDDCRR